MAPDHASTVTIERGYFETLLRRAQSKPPDVPISRQSPTSDALTVNRSDYETLQRIAKQYENLRRNLLRGGVGEDTIDLLSQNDSTIQHGEPAQGVASANQRATSLSQPRMTIPSVAQLPLGAVANRRPSAANGNGHNFQHGGGGGGGRYQEQDWSEMDPAQDEISCSGDTPADETTNGQSYYNTDHAPASSRPHYDRQSTRTIQLLNLPEGTTHADITSVVRGGQLLDIFLRSHDRSATVSFLHAHEARTFFDYCRRHDLYVRNKRVEVRWNDRQFILSGHVASKIGIGATRNLVIRRCDPRITEESIREDLEHIHNLAVIKIEFIGGSCFISTNSVHNAMFARTCMMSRFKFKGSKIDWDVDECAQPLGRMQPARPRKEPPPAKKPNSAITNRFQLLNLDREDDDDSAPDLPRAQEAVGIVA